jgi:hypothetical protein
VAENSEREDNDALDMSIDGRERVRVKELRVISERENSGGEFGKYVRAHTNIIQQNRCFL